MKMRFVTIAMAVVFGGGMQQAVYGANGWTNPGAIVSVEQDPANYGSVSNSVFVVVSVTSNPSGCSSATGFYFSLEGATAIDSDRKKRLFTMLLMAQVTSQPIRLFVTGVCHTVGYAEIDGMNM